MNLTIIIISIYALISIYFFIKFFKNGMSLSDTIGSIKKDLSKIFPCCIDKKNIADKISPEKADELENEMKKVTEKEDSDCKEPFGVPLDVCLDGNLSKEEILIREKVLKIINKKDYKVKDGGMDKLVLPMESILFLTKSLNPLVSETGNITIKINSLANNGLNQNNSEIPSEEIEKLIIELKDRDSILYKDDEELLNSINSLLKHKKFEQPKVIEEAKEEDSIPVKVDVIKTETEENDISNAFNNNDIQTINGPDEDDIPITPKSQPKKEPKQTEEKEVKIFAPNSPYDNEDDEIDLSDLDSEIGDSDMDLNDLLMAELENIEIDDDEEKKDEKDFYKELSYKTVKNASFDFDNIEDSIKTLFSKDESFYALFKNIAKSEPLIFNGNKTVCIVDQNIVLFAIAKMFGMESKGLIEEFKKLDKKVLIKINNILVDKLELYLSDLLSGNRKPNFYLVKDKEQNQYFSFAFVFQTNAFKTSLNSEEFDYFRSFPYNNQYEFVKKASKEETANSSKLIMDIKDVEIK